jgi:hypothetical protein
LRKPFPIVMRRLRKQDEATSATRKPSPEKGDRFPTSSIAFEVLADVRPRSLTLPGPPSSAGRRTATSGPRVSGRSGRMGRHQ